eukprot:TRINITY_DN562_c6_g1_i1.p1 TRINITY_DN562_c6_g1~~TRINITY_DN562_c6_g1_i1.p1  ORF type:complete len:362 (+),score=93.27 TRINITY_DN562_c6_g1_i1:296-1381(+)
MSSNSLRKKAASRASGMPPPPPPRPSLPFGSLGVSKPQLEPRKPETCFDRIHDVNVGGGDTFRVYQSDGPSGAPAAILLIHGAGTCAMSWALCADSLRQHAPVVAFDMRGHGATHCQHDSDLSADTLCDDIIAVMRAVFPEGQRVLLVGHSLGGALAVQVCRRPGLPVTLTGCVVEDVVEGTALESLRHMKSVLAKRPSRFADISTAIQWGAAGSGVRNEESARASMPGQVVERGGAFHWRTDLLATEPFWEGWFKGMSAWFLGSSCPKLLLLAGTDRLDKELSIGHMQGKFQLTVMGGTGHFMHEDKPAEVAEIVMRFYNRFTRPIPRPSVVTEGGEGGGGSEGGLSTPSRQPALDGQSS